MDAAQKATRFLRQSEIADPDKFKYAVSILGIGAIGSSIAIALSKMGSPKGMTLVDYDLFEEHNVANQFCYEKKHIGFPKAQAISKLCGEMGYSADDDHGSRYYFAKLMGPHLIPYELSYPDDSTGPIAQPNTDPHTPHELNAKKVFKGIIVSTPDSMQARKDLWTLCKYNPDTPYLIDVRVGGLGQYIVIYTTGTMLTEDIKRYEETLHTDEEANQDPCGARGVSYTSFVAGGFATNLIKKLQLGEEVPQQIQMDLSTFELTQVLANGEMVTNREALALASVKDK